MAVDYAEMTRLVRKGRRAEQRSAAVEGCLTSLLAGALNALLKGWFLMLAVAVMHDHWVPQLPAIGYWWAVLVMYLMPNLGSASTVDKT